jgi:hypothetical protein
MNGDELRERLSGIDPSAAAPIHPVDGPWAASLLEQIMNTPIQQATPTPQPPGRAVRRTWLWAALGAVVAAGAITAGIVASGDDEQPVASEPIEYALDGAVSMDMCLRVDEYEPTPDVLGLRGTITALDADTATLQVSKWYRGGPADEVVLRVSNVPSPALDGIEFVVGGDYLIAVRDGEVLTCGLSALYSDDLAALYEGWFAG